jgi:hypothetical protein
MNTRFIGKIAETVSPFETAVRIQRIYDAITFDDAEILPNNMPQVVYETIINVLLKRSTIPIEIYLIIKKLPYVLFESEDISDTLNILFAFSCFQNNDVPQLAMQLIREITSCRTSEVAKSALFVWNKFKDFPYYVEKYGNTIQASKKISIHLSNFFICRNNMEIYVFFEKLIKDDIISVRDNVALPLRFWRSDNLVTLLCNAIEMDIDDPYISEKTKRIISLLRQIGDKNALPTLKKMPQAIWVNDAIFACRKNKLG